MKIKAALVLLIMMSPVLLFSEMHFLLYGFKIGQKINTVTNQFGKPAELRKFEDGFKAYIYKFDDHYAIFETDSTRPDMIWGIQIAGKTNPADYGLSGLNLGDDIKKMYKILGKPDEKKQAFDEITGEKMDNTYYHSYLKKGNMSIETVDDKVTSIKINYNGNRESENMFNIKPFIKNVKSGDLLKLTEYISSEIAISKNGRSYSIDKSVYDALKNDEIIKDIFYNKEYGVAVSETKCKIESRERLAVNGPSGEVFTFTKGDFSYELFFIRSFDGWVLYEINVLD